MLRTVGPLLLALSVAGEVVDLRLLFHQGVFMQPRAGKYRNPCNDVLAEGCLGGTATVASLMRQQEVGARAVLRLVGYQMDRFTQFSPHHLRLNNLNWEQLRAHAAFIGEPAFLTLTGQQEHVREWLITSTTPLVAGGYTTDGSDANMLSLLPATQQYGILRSDDGRWSIGVICVLPPHTFVQTVPLKDFVPAIAAFLRASGVDMVVAVCSEQIGGVWPAGSWVELAGSVDVVIPPSCPVEDCDPAANVSAINGTWFMPAADSGAGSGSTNADHFAVFDFVQDGAGLRPVSSKSVDAMVPVPAALANSTEHQSVLRWLQDRIDEANSADHTIGYSTAPMPDGRVLDSQGEIVDEVCRRDACPLGQMAGDAVYRKYDDVDIVLTNGGSLRFGWAEGGIVLSAVYEAMPFDNYICIFDTTGPGLWQVLSKFVSAVLADGSYDSSSEIRGGFPQTVGMRFDFDPTRPIGRNLLKAELFNRHTGEWESIRRTRHYKVATSTFLCSGGDDYRFVFVGEHNTLKVLHQELIVDLITGAPYAPPTVSTSVYINDPRESFLLPLLTPSNCSAATYWVSEWEECVPCPLGEVQDSTDVERCSRVAEGSASQTWVWILVAVVGAFALIMAAAAWKYTANWRRMRHLYSTNVIATRCAESIASLRLEEVSYIRDIPNPNELQLAFIKIIDILLEYRSFMPQVLRVQLSADADNRSSEMSEGTRVRPRAERASFASTIHASTEAPESPTLVHDGSSSMRSFDSRTHHRPPHEKNRSPSVVKLSIDLIMKRPAVLWMGTTGYHQTFNGVEAPLQSCLVVGCVVELTDSHRGVVDQMSGDRIMVTFGALRECVMQRVQAAYMAASLPKALASGGYAERLRIGIESGNARVGTLGSQSLKKHTVVGSVVNVAFACSRAAAMYDQLAVVGTQFYDGTSIEVQYSPLALWRYPKVTDTYVCLFRFVALKESQGNNEWMYQMEHSHAADAFQQQNESLRKLAREQPVSEEMEEPPEPTIGLRHVPISVAF
eukprot:TRINITY_DN28200_c0_g1_i1.p1 TRINITY_DN28200_c0_g1~~TRINITY_DN28200_c0_g1_i1.p1  ORF type:complete len:1012 (+),score=186.69 TRINITY_DN28200_c0_g1_i1:59-3094(+)